MNLDELPIYDPEAEDRAAKLALTSFDYTVPPKTLNVSRRVQGRMCLAGKGPKPAKIMMVATSVEEEEVKEETEILYGNVKVKVKAEYLKGWSGTLLRQVTQLAGLDISEIFYTSLLKWLLPTKDRNRPKVEEINWGLPMLLSELAEVQPDIIVTFGKPAFEALTGVKLSLQDIKGSWFRCLQRPETLVFPMDALWLLMSKPDYQTKFITDLEEVKRRATKIGALQENLFDKERPKYTDEPCSFHIANTLQDVQGFVLRWMREGRRLFSVDCEWAGDNHVDGKLRSIQFAWTGTEALYIKFMDENMNYTFDGSYQQVGAILGSWLNQPQVKYIGHHICADFPWMHHWLGLDVYGKCEFDTEFAQQCIDESETLGLERICMLYTNIGRYDLDLLTWTKKNSDKIKNKKGYGLIPDSIIIDYALFDVIVPFRAYAPMMHELRRQDLAVYYYETFLPFVSDGFTLFSLIGLPFNKGRMDEMRELYLFARDNLLTRLKAMLVLEAASMLKECMSAYGATEAQLYSIEALLCNGQEAEAMEVVKRFADPQYLETADAVMKHFIKAPSFNFNSAAMLAPYLFEVKGYTPLKSTQRKEKGLPAMAWDKVLALPPGRRKEYAPAVDKQTLQVLAERQNDELLKDLLDYKAVATMCRSFLRPAELDHEGNVVKENGFHYFLASNLKCHGGWSATETSRPRSWKPNLLNMAGFVNDNIARAVATLIKWMRETPGMELNPKFAKYENVKLIPPLRSIVDVSQLPPAPGSQGWCIVESDFQTAEVRCLAFKAGDEALLADILMPDQNFAILAADKEISVRLWFPDYLPVDGELIMHYKDKQGNLVAVTEAELVKDEEGKILHPRTDMHWKLAEQYRKKPRERMVKSDRNSSKVVRFSSTYGAGGPTLDRKIESDTGVRPEPGTGDGMLATMNQGAPVAHQYLLDMAGTPEKIGYWRSESGRVRHAKTFGYAEKDRNIVASLGRELRNFPMQESVGATAARGFKWLVEKYARKRLWARPIFVLYDSIGTLCPIEERFLVSEYHQQYMCDENTWRDHGRVWNYPIDTEFNFAWSWHKMEDKKMAAELDILNNVDYNSDPTQLPPCDRLFYHTGSNRSEVLTSLV